MKSFAILLVLGLAGVSQIAGHGRVVDPPQRGSLWRFPEYAFANPGKPADDQENLCGGTSVTDPYIGACGLCGDSILEPRPRAHEIGGFYDRGIITRTYTAGSTINVELFMAVDHQGWYEFRLCPYSVTGEESEACFNQYPLRFANGEYRITRPGSQNQQIQLQLPAGVRCERCVLQWYWFGEGSNQHYKNCADIKIQ